ncbi:histidine kinase [Niabella ginsenosidivorans]|uniref:Histidine kinase n=1 Tax=Niabella ginsenosidivorans TaxID=1176587 RepID=A0A1A9I1W1_9BACT|nr:tetratricopeptide repeat-containing sensor histidine kinase [Niabella ginsenosidivorans]ANH80554.1 histidine kinase [Niabella ginsenosidivorans]
MKLSGVIFLILVTGLTGTTWMGCQNGASQQVTHMTAEAKGIIAMPDSPAKVDSIIVYTGRNRKKSTLDTLFKIGFELVERLKYRQAEPKLLDAYGVYNRDFSRYDIALESHQKSIELARKNKDVHTEIRALNNIGVVYRRLDENGKAITNHMAALRLAEKTGDDFSASVALNSIGNIHIVLGNYDDAIRYFQKGLPIAQKAKNYLGMAMNYNNIGEAYELKRELDSADSYYKQSLFYNEKIKSAKGIAISYNSIGSILKKEGKLNEALTLFKKARIITDTLGDEIYRAGNYNSLGDIYLRLKQYDSSRNKFLSALVIAKSIGTMTEARNAYEGLMRLNEQTGHLDSALNYSKLFKAYSDSIVAESNNLHVRQMEALYSTEKERAKINALETKRRNDHIFGFGALILFILILVSGILYYLRYRLLEHNKRLQQQLEIRTQIASDLHDDMGSSLSSIHIFSELLRKSGNNKEELLTKIEENARDTLDALDDIIWLVKPTNDRFENLCQHIREYAVPMFESKEIRFTIDFPESIAEIPLPMDVRRNIFLIIKESVNNLVKYSQCTEAAITAIDEDTVIFFAIKDNGIGFDAAKLTNRNGVKNIQARAKSMKADIKITTASGAGTLVEFWVKKDRTAAAEAS